jgi:hypothetical protein
MKPRAASEKKGGRKPASEAQPDLVPAIEAVIADDTAGSPGRTTKYLGLREPACPA